MSLPGLTPPKTKLPPAPAKVEAPPIEVPPVEAPPASAATPPTSTDAPAGVAAPSASTPITQAAPPTVKPVTVPGLAPTRTRVSTATPKPAIDTSAARRAVYDTSRRARERGESLDTDQVMTAAAASLGVSPADLERTAGVDLRPYINPGDRDFRSLELDERDAEKAPPGGIRTVTTGTIFTDPGYAFGGLAGKDHPAFKAFMEEAEKFAADNPDVMTPLQSVDKSLTLADSKSKILSKLIRDKGFSSPAALPPEEFDRLNKKALRLAVAGAVRGRDLPGGAFGDLGINFPQSALSGDTYEDYVRQGRLGRAALTAVKDNPVHVVGLDTFGNLVIMDKTTADKVFKFDDLIMSAAIGAGQGAGKIATDIRRGKDVNLTDIPYQMGRAMSMGEEPVERLGRTYGTLGERTARMLATYAGADAEGVQDASTAGRVAGAAFGAAAGLGASLFAPGLGTDVVLPMSIAGASKGLSRLTPVRPTQPPATAASAFEAPPGEGAPIVTALESLTDKVARDAAAARLEEIGEALMTGRVERAAELERKPLTPGATGGSFRGDAPEAVALLDREDRNALAVTETMLGDAPSRRLLTDQAWAPSVLDADQFILKVGDKEIKPLRGLPAASGSVRRAAPATSQAESAFALYDFKGRLDILADARKRVKELAATGDLPVDSVGWRRLLRGVQGAPLSKEGDKRLLAAFRKPGVLSPEDSAKYDAAIDAIQKELDALITPGYAKDDAAPARIAEQAKRSLAAFRSLVDPEKVNRATIAAVRRQKAKNVLANRDREKFIADADDVSRRGRLFGDAEVPADMVEPASLENYGDGTSKVTDLKVAKLKDGTWAILRGGLDDVGVQGEEVLASLAASDEAALAEAIAENTDPQDVLDALAPAQIQRLVASETAEEVLESAEGFDGIAREAIQQVAADFTDTGITPDEFVTALDALESRRLVEGADRAPALVDAEDVAPRIVEGARRYAANALARVAIKSESTWLDRAKTGKRGRKRILEVIRAARDKQGRARNRLGSNVALITDNDYDIAKHFIASIGTKRLEQVALAIEPAVRLRNSIFANEPLGVNYMASQVIGISHLAISTGRFTSTVIHELWHTLSQFIPKDTLADMYRQFVMERAAFAVANPGAFDAAGRLRVINYVEGQSTYRYASFDEWVVEKMTDLSIADAVGKISNKRIREQGTKVFMSPGMQALRALRALAESTYHQVETVHGADAVREAFLDFQSGLFLERLRDTSLAAISEVNEAERALQAKWTAFIADLASGKPPEVAREDFVGATRDFLNSMAWRSPDRITGAEDTIDGGLDALEEIQSAAAIIPPQFVSRLEAALETFPGKRATIDQIEAYLKKSKVKDVELEMAGFQAFKDDLAARGVKSVTLDEARQSLKAAQDRFKFVKERDFDPAALAAADANLRAISERRAPLEAARARVGARAMDVDVASSFVESLGGDTALGEATPVIVGGGIADTIRRGHAASDLSTPEAPTAMLFEGPPLRDGRTSLRSLRDFADVAEQLAGRTDVDAPSWQTLRFGVQGAPGKLFEARNHLSVAQAIYENAAARRAAREAGQPLPPRIIDLMGAPSEELRRIRQEVEQERQAIQAALDEISQDERAAAQEVSELSFRTQWEDYSIKGGKDYSEIRVIDEMQQPELTAAGRFRYHFEQTAAVHTRVKTRDSSEGPVLGMDEMQSDHYQAKPVGEPPPNGKPDNRPKVAGEGVFSGDRWKYAGIRAAVIEAARRGLNGVAAPDGALAANAVGATMELDPKAHEALVAFYDVQVPRLMKDVARDLGLAVREIDVPDYGRKVTAIMFDGKAVQGVPLFAKGAKKADVPAIKPPPEIVPVAPLPVNRPGSYVNVQFASPVDAAVYLWVQKGDNPAVQQAIATFYKAATGRDLDIGEVTANISKITAAAKAEVDALKTLSKSADKPTIVKVKPLVDYIEGTVFDGWKIASKERLALEGAGPALLALKDRLAANLTADQVVAKVNGYRDAAVKAFRNDKQGKRSIFIVGATPEEIDAIAAAVDERLAIGGLTLKAQYTNPTNKTYFVTERIQPGAIEVAPPAAKPAPAAKVQHPKLSKELASAPLNVRGKRVSFASDLDRAAFVVTRAKTPEDAAEYLKFVSDATGMDEAAVRAHGAKVAKAIGDQAAKAKESTAFTLARVYDGAVVDTKAAAPAATAAVTPAATATPAAAPDPDWWKSADAADLRAAFPALAALERKGVTFENLLTVYAGKVKEAAERLSKSKGKYEILVPSEAIRADVEELARRAGLSPSSDTPVEAVEVKDKKGFLVRIVRTDDKRAVVQTVAAPKPTPAAVVDAVDAPTVIAPARPTAPPAPPAPAAPTPPTPTAPPRKPYQLVARIGVNQDGDVDVAEIFGKADLVDLRALYNRLTSIEAGKGDVDAADVPFDIAGDLAANERAAKALFAPISARASSPPTSDEASVGKAIEALDAFLAGVSDLHAQARQYRAARGEKEALAEIDEVIDATLMAAEIRGLAAYRAAAALRAGAATPLYGDVPEVRAVTQAVIDRPGFATKLREVVNTAAGRVNPNEPIARVAYGEGSSVPLIVDTASTQRIRALSRPMSGEVDKIITEKVKIAADAEPNMHTVLIRFQGEDVHYTPEKFEEILDRAVSEYAAAEQAARASGKTGLNLNVLLARANRDFGVELVERRAVKIPDAVIAKDDAAIAAALAGGRHTWKPHEVAIDRMFNDTNGDVPPPGYGFVHAPVPVFRSRVLEPKAIPSIRSDLSSNEAIDVESVFPRATPRRRGASISIRSFTEAVDQALAAPFLQDGGGPGALRTVLRKMVLPFIGEASALPFLRAPASLRPFMATLANEVEQGIGDMVVMLRQAPSGDLIFRYLSGEPGLVTPFGIPVASAGRINAAENARATMTRLYEAFLSGGENSPGAQVVKGFTYTGTEWPVTQADLLAGAVAAARAARKSGDKFNVVGWINSTFDLPRDPKGAPLDKDAIGAATTAINNAISAITGARVISAGKDAAVGDQAVADIAPDFLRDMRKILLSQGETALGRTPPTDLPLIDLLTDPDPNYNDPEQVRALVNSLVSIIATSTLDDLAINRRAVNLVVHMAAYAQATHGLVRLSRTGVAITPDQFNLITRALNSEYLEEAERAEAERLVRVFGMVEGSDMERIDITGEDIYVPRSVAQILAQAFSKAKPIELAAFGRGKDALAARGELIARSASTAVVRGNILLKNSKMVQDTVDGFFRVMTMTDPSVTARYTARTASAAIYGLIPGLAPMIQIARQKGQELDVVGSLADGGQAAATAINRYVGALSDTERAAFHAKVEDMLKLGMQRPSVLAVWRGDNVVVPTAIGQTTARELRDVMQQHGVLSSFDTSQRVEASLRDLFGMTYAEAQKNPTAAVQNMIGRVKGLSPHIAKELLRSPLDALQWTREVTSSTMEQFSSMERISLAVTLLEDGFDPVSAARSTSAILYNYGRTIHGADRSLFVALFLPFWAWRKNNNRAVLDLMFSQQGRVALMRARRAQAGIFGSAQSIIDAYTADEYGIDTEQMTPTQREMYYGMVFALEREHGYPLPVEQIAALRAVVSNQVGTTLQVGGEQYLTSGNPSTGFTQLAAKFLKAGAGGNPMLAAPGRANERYLRNVRGRAQVRMLQVDPNTASPQQIAAMIMQETETAAMIATAVNVLGVIGMVAAGTFNAAMALVDSKPGVPDMPYAIEPSELPFTAADAEMSPLYGQIIAAWQGLTSPETDGMTRVPDEIGYLLASMGGDLVTIRRQPVATEDPNNQVEMKESYYVSTATWSAINLISIFALQDAKREFEQAAQAYKVAMEANDKDAAATAFETMITLLGYRIRRGADERIGTEGMDANSARRE